MYWLRFGFLVHSRREVLLELSLSSCAKRTEVGLLVVRACCPPALDAHSDTIEF